MTSIKTNCHNLITSLLLYCHTSSIKDIIPGDTKSERWCSSLSREFAWFIVIILSFRVHLRWLDKATFFLLFFWWQTDKSFTLYCLGSSSVWFWGMGKVFYEELEESNYRQDLSGTLLEWGKLFVLLYLIWLDGFNPTDG